MFYAGAPTGSGSSLSIGALLGLSGGAAAAATFGISAAITAVFAIIGHHKAAVRNEAQALNYAVPGVESAFKQIADAFSSGAASQSDALGAVDQTLQQYESTVYQQFGVKQKAGNGPDVVEKTWLQVWAGKLKDALTSGGGTVHLDAIPAHAGFAGTEAFDLTVAAPSSSSGTVAALTSPLAGVPVWLWLLVAVAVFLFVEF